MNHSPTFYRRTALRRALDRFLDSIADELCSCEGCSRHKGACPGSRSRHAVVLHTFEGRKVCHLCVAAILEARGARLYPDV